MSLQHATHEVISHRQLKWGAGAT